MNPWAWHAHPSVWVVIGLSVGAYAYGIRVIGARLGGTVTRRQIATFAAGILVMWAAADWPVHDLAENYLFSVHMVQHIMLTLVAPPLMLAGTPPWLLRWVLQQAPALAAIARKLGRPLPAALIYNVAFVFTHWPAVVNAGLNSEALHFSLHCLIFFTAMLMWFPVLNRLPEFPMMSPPARLVYLFLQSVIPTVPASFITFATGAIYEHYAAVPHPFHLSVVADQQLAGALMKVVGGSILWGVIIVMFFKWYADEHDPKRALPRDVLTWDDVARELERTPPPPSV